MPRPGFLFCVCPDSELIMNHIRSLVSKQPETWRMRMFWADEELPSAYWEALSYSGLLNTSSAVVLRRAEALPIASWKKFNLVLNRFRAHTWPFFCLEQGWAKGKPSIPASLRKQKFFRLAEDKGWVWKSPGINRQSLRRSLEKWAGSQTKSFTPQALDLAQSLMPLEAAALKNELLKLELLTHNEPEIQKHHLKSIAFQPDMDSFQFLKTLQSNTKKASLWRKLLRDQLASGQETVLPFLGLILWEARQLWQLAVGDTEQVNLPPQIKREKLSLAQKMGPQKIAAIWTQALEAEVGIKSGAISGGQAMEILVSKLMKVFAR